MRRRHVLLMHIWNCIVEFNAVQQFCYLLHQGDFVEKSLFFLIGGGGGGRRGERRGDRTMQ